MTGVLTSLLGVLVHMLSGYGMPILLIVAAALIVWGCSIEVEPK